MFQNELLGSRFANYLSEDRPNRGSEVAGVCRRKFPKGSLFHPVHRERQSSMGSAIPSRGPNRVARGDISTGFSTKKSAPVP